MNKHKLTQAEAVAAYIDAHGYIDRQQAMDCLSVWNLPEVVRKMKLKGMPVVTVDKPNRGRYARENDNYAIYAWKDENAG